VETRERTRCYEILGVPRDATREQIRNAYRRLALLYHPDRNKSPTAQEKFEQISEAYAQAFALLDESETESPSTPDSNLDQTQFQEEQSVIFVREGRQTLRELGGAGSRDTICELDLTLEEVANGTRKIISITKKAVCSFCGGKSQNCNHCHGTGVEEEVSNTPLTLPAGAEEGMQFKVGAAFPGQFEENVYVQVTIKPHKIFRSDKAGNIYYDLHVPSRRSRSRYFEVPTVNGPSVALHLPPSTKKGTMFVIHGRGLPRWGTAAKSDLVVKIV
jgi:molecular chaperone DnaJ